GLIGYRGLARILLEDRSVGGFPDWLNRLGQQPLAGPFPLALLIFGVMLIVAIFVLQFSAFGRYVYVIGNNREVARYSVVNVRRDWHPLDSIRAEPQLGARHTQRLEPPPADRPGAGGRQRRERRLPDTNLDIPVIRPIAACFLATYPDTGGESR